MTRFPTGEGRWQVSRGGGEGPEWPRDVDELVFLGGTPGGPRSLMAAPIRLAPEVVIGAPLKLFDIAADLTGEFDVAPDSKQFVMIRRGTKAGSQPVRWVFVQNWLADLARTR